MKPGSPVPLDEVVRLVQAGSKYADISPDLVRSVAARELARQANLKETVKATRNKLHQVGSAYQEATIPYAQLRKELEGLPAPLNDVATLNGLKRFMAFHASTRERLPILDRMFRESLAPIAPITSVLDIACGFNPFAIPWMPLAESFSYQALDIYGQMVELLNHFFVKYHIDGQAQVSNVLQALPDQPVQLALILKTIPCLEQLDKSAGLWLLENVNAENMLVSFPAHSLGGRSKGMVQNYEAHFNELTAGKGWQMQRFEFPGELAFLVQKQGCIR